MVDDTGPWRLVRLLQAWAEVTPWVEWLELSGSLGRGAGDELSDVDAGIGVVGDREALQSKALQAVREFAHVADELVQPWGDNVHLVVQYADGRQLSLVVMPAESRQGLPPGALALVDRQGRLGTRWQPTSLTASPAQQREWAFLAWWGLSDVAKHARRDNVWRAITSLNEVRDLAWRLHAAALGVDYPLFGAVSVENAGLAAPQGISATLPVSSAADDVLSGARALAEVLARLTAGHDVDGVRTVALNRLG